jgi:hypothetical protein
VVKERKEDTIQNKKRAERNGKRKVQKGGKEI